MARILVYNRWSRNAPHSKSLRLCRNPQKEAGSTETRRELCKRRWPLIIHVTPITFQQNCCLSKDFQGMSHICRTRPIPGSLSALSACHYTSHTLTSLNLFFAPRLNPLPSLGQSHVELLSGNRKGTSSNLSWFSAVKFLLFIFFKLWHHVYRKMLPLHCGGSVPVSDHIHHL